MSWERLAESSDLTQLISEEGGPQMHQSDDIVLHPVPTSEPTSTAASRAPPKISRQRQVQLSIKV